MTYLSQFDIKILQKVSPLGRGEVGQLVWIHFSPLQLIIIRFLHLLGLFEPSHSILDVSGEFVYIS